MKVEINLGRPCQTAKLNAGSEVMCDLEELLATRLLVQGNSGSGKSHLLRRLLEQSAPWVQQCVIDPEGDFVTLADKFDHIVVEATRSEQELTRIAGRVRQHRVSAVLNLEGLETEQQMRAAAAFLGGLFDAARDFWYPMLVVVDEAQLFAPAVAGEVSDEARKLSLGSMTNLMCRGRKRGLAGVIATQRLAKLAKNVAAEASNFLMGRTFLDIDMARASDLLGMERRQAEMFRDLERGHFIALGPALSRRPLVVEIGTVETQARSSSPKLMPLPTPDGDIDALIFTPTAEELRATTRRMTTPPKPTPKPITEILEEVARHQQKQEKAQTSAPDIPLFPEIENRERESLFDHVMREIVSDPEASYRSIAVLYQDFLVRCRIQRIAGAPLDLSAFRRRLAVAQARINEEVSSSETWQQALLLSENLNDDVQGVFLHLAQAAVTGQPCPGDATLARLYGTHSLARARWLLSYFEERGLTVMREDFSGKRIVAFPDLGLETAPGHPDAPDDVRPIDCAAQ